MRHACSTNRVHGPSSGVATWANPSEISKTKPSRPILRLDPHQGLSFPRSPSHGFKIPDHRPGAQHRSILPESSRRRIPFHHRAVRFPLILPTSPYPALFVLGRNPRLLARGPLLSRRALSLAAGDIVAGRLALVTRVVVGGGGWVRRGRRRMRSRGR